jgi:dynein heavy chain
MAALMIVNSALLSFIMSTETAANINQIQNYMKTWEQFRDLWEVNTDIFIMQYEDLKPSVSSFDRDIGR